MTDAVSTPPGLLPPREDIDSPRRDLMIGGVIIALFFGLFLGWATFAPLDAGAFASGQVAVSGNRQSVQHRDGGVVSALHVAEGDRVTRGQVLIELNSAELRATERGVTGQVMALLAQRARMIAERDRLGSIPVPPEFASLEGGDRRLADDAMRLQRLQFEARRSGRSTETGVLDQQVAQLNQQIAGLQEQIASNDEQTRLIQQQLDAFGRVDQKYIPVNRLRELERTAAALKGEGGDLRAQVARIRAAIGQTRLETLGVSTKLNEDVAERLRQTEIELNELRPRMLELRRQIAAAQVRAPATGQVVGLSVFTPGGVITPGQTLMDVVPDNASQVIIASVDPTDVDNLRIGQETEVKFPGLRERSIPILHGKVTRISADSFEDQATGRSHYRAEVVVPPAELEKLGPKLEQIRPGVPVQVVILLRKRTALDYLIEPLTSNLWRTGSEQ